MKRNVFTTALLACVLAVSAYTAGASEAGRLLEGLAANQAEPVWLTAQRLSEVGTTGHDSNGYAQIDPAVVQAANDDARSVPERMAAAGALLLLGEQREGTIGLEKIAMNQAVSMDRRLEAAQILGKWGGEYATARLGIMLGASNVPEWLRVELAYSLWKLSSRPQAYQALEDIRVNGQSSLARAEATLALAQTDRFHSLRDEVRKLADSPGIIGERAQNILLINNRVAEEVRRDDFTVLLISEVIQKIRNFYAADEEDKDQAKRLQPRQLAESSAQALLYSLDQFNDYMNEEDYQEFESQLKANYGGIGAWVGMRDGRFTILTPMYDKPAFRAGLQPMDVIDKIDDTEIKDMKQNEIIKLLKGPANTTVRLRVYRRTWKEPREVAVRRDIIEIQSVKYQMLPGSIGYIRINSFNDGDPYRRVKGTAGLVKDALAKLNREGAKGIILDLSNNPGGVMVSGVDVAKLFIGERKTIVSSKGKRNFSRPTFYYANPGRPFYQKPVVVVVNPGTASAAEIVAGAMRDHDRAPLIGRKTYGKGSVQSLIGVDAARDRSRIKLTVAKYYLPNGDCIHEKGIEPDYKVPENDLSVAEAEARWKMRDHHDVTFWLQEENRWERYENEFRRLLEFDNLDPYAYPEFESLLTQLQEKYPKERIEPDLVRKELRYGIATYLRDFKGEENHNVDLEENAYLQEAVLVLGDMIGGLPDTPFFATIRGLAEENRKKLAEEDLAENTIGD
ncbi:MAG: S41 family peptidase [Planctomycetes bacterium]|nr:S41 family peptidase [Planctomycetota bacterium]